MEPLDQILDAPVSSQPQMRYAGFWIRVGAYLIDGILLAVVNVILGLVIGSSSGSIGAALLVNAISIGIGLAYFAGLESSEKQATLGKQAVGIKVGNVNGEKITFANALGRYFGKIISGLLLGIGFMMVGWDEKKQGIHDKLADTYVFYA
ncbi:RDD family protein [Ohtaekwangia kribbensis]|jgi:uncharacterized RDD family membrane protein YckC|uniref:RDD family protein n=1 Tax=Ohtaekwangia kribbensis TaxID=688913 RepID=A0ABW3K0D7_9BACT